MKKQKTKGRFRLHNPIFVIGMPRSGTTIISEALSVHEELGWFSNHFKWFPVFPEVSFLSRTIDLPLIGCFFRGKKTQDPGLMPYIRRFMPFCSEAYTVWNRYSASDFDNDYLIGRTASRSEKKKFREVVNKVLRFQEKKRFFSKLTGPSRIEFIKSIFPSAYFIHIIRDPRANVSSLLNVSFWKENQGYEKPWWQNGLSTESLEEWRKYKNSPVSLCAIQWREIVKGTWIEKNIVSQKNFYEINYEKFVDDPIKIVNKVYEFVGLNSSNATINYLNTVGKVYDRKQSYLHYLKKGDIEIIEEITYETAKKAGYLF